MTQTPDQQPMLSEEQAYRAAVIAAEKRVAECRFALADAEAHLVSLQLTRRRDALALEVDGDHWRWDPDGGDSLLGAFVRKGHVADAKETT